MKFGSKKLCMLDALLAASMILFVSSGARAASGGLDPNGNGDKTNVVALYTFNETSGNVVHDQMTSNGALNLSIAPVNPNSKNPYQWVSKQCSSNYCSGGLDITDNVWIESQSPATKIITALNQSNAFTIEVWIQDSLSNKELLMPNGPVRIVALTHGVLQGQYSGAVSNFYLGQGYMAGDFFDLGINEVWKLDPKTQVYGPTGQMFMTNPSDTSIVRASTTAPIPEEHIFVTRDNTGTVTMYVSDPTTGAPVVETLTNASTSNPSNPALDLANDLYLTLANDYQTTNNLSVSPDSSFNVYDKPWAGTLQMVAIYDKALTQSQILGSLAPTDWITNAAEGTSSNASFSPAVQMASLMYQRLDGIRLPYNSNTIQTMAADLGSGDPSTTARLQAADVATSATVNSAQNPASAPFYNITVADFAKRMSNIAGVTQVPLNDFAADVIGATRDSMGIRNMLTGNYYYMADPNKAAVPSDLVGAMIMSNDHYSSLEADNYDLSSVLIQKSGQQFYNGNSALTPASNIGDAAGLLTTRQFGSEALSAGTNRRAIRFSFNTFLCEDITQWGDANDPDQFVGRDVDRFPTGNHNVYTSTCRACHAPMDGMRPAFAHFTFEDGFLKNAIVMTNDTSLTPDNANNEDNPSLMVIAPAGISAKYNKNTSVFPGGYSVTNDSFVNFTNRPGTPDAAYFGWDQAGDNGTQLQTDGSITGHGVQAFAQMLADAQAFPRCMAQQAFFTVCKRQPDLTNKDDQQAISGALSNAKFTAANGKTDYDMRKIFEYIAVQKDCLGE